MILIFFFFFQAEDGIRDGTVTGVQTCALPICVGICGGWDDTCLSCLRGDFINCTNGVLTGIMIDGGYAEVMIIEARTTVTIPDGLEPVKSAPLLCAGVTTYNALRNAGLRAGALVAIQGVGGLGHLGIQYARRMG